MMSIAEIIAWSHTLDPLWYNGMNFAVCVSVFITCICRLRLTSTDTRVFIRFAHCFILVMMVISALRGPIFGSVMKSLWPILLTLCVLLLQLINIRAWKHAPPDNLQKRPTTPMPLHSDF